MKKTKEQIKEEIVKKWKALEFLKDLKGHVKPEIVALYECSERKGDDASVGEELMMGVTEEEEIRNVVNKAVNEEYFSMNDALKLYDPKGLLIDLREGL
jgi:hypothetical protein